MYWIRGTALFLALICIGITAFLDNQLDIISGGNHYLQTVDKQTVRCYA